MVCLHRAINAVAGERNSSVSAAVPFPALQNRNHFERVEKGISFLYILVREAAVLCAGLKRQV